MRIPEIADRLRDIAAESGVSELVGLADELRRRPSGRRAPAKSQPMSDTLIAQIRRMRCANPSMSQVEISRRLNCNQGRVSEALKGKRT